VCKIYFCFLSFHFSTFFSFLFFLFLHLSYRGPRQYFFYSFSFLPLFCLIRQLSPHNTSLLRTKETLSLTFSYRPARRPGLRRSRPTPEPSSWTLLMSELLSESESKSESESTWVELDCKLDCCHQGCHCSLLCSLFRFFRTSDLIESLRFLPTAESRVSAPCSLFSAAECSLLCSSHSNCSPLFSFSPFFFPSLYLVASFALYLLLPCCVVCGCCSVGQPWGVCAFFFSWCFKFVGSLMIVWEKGLLVWCARFVSCVLCSTSAVSRPTKSYPRSVLFWRAFMWWAVGVLGSLPWPCFFFLFFFLLFFRVILALPVVRWCLFDFFSSVFLSFVCFF